MALCIFPIWFIGEGPLLAEDCLLPEFYESPLTRKLTLRLDYSAAIYDPKPPLKSIIIFYL
jgi:hypothetical protein